MSTLTLDQPPTTIATAPPVRSAEQRRIALDRANVVRSRRGQLKRDLKAGRVEFLDLLDDPPEWLLTAKVYEILLHVPKVGRVKVQNAFRRHEIAPSKTFEGISRRQREKLRGDIHLPTAKHAWGRS